MSKIKKIIISIAIIITVIIGLALCLGGTYLYNLALDPTTDKSIVFGSDKESTEAISQNETSGEVNIDAETWLLNDSGYESLYRTSKDGLKLHNYLLKNNSNKWVITVHGYTSEGKLMSNYGKKFYDMGYNVLIPDLRGHGMSEGDYIGMGWDERLDIIDLINYIIDVDKDSEIVLFGVSMGAATVMNVSGENLPSNVKAIIEDCGYTSAWDQFSYQLDELFGLPPFPMMHTASLIGKFRAGYWLKDASPLEQVKKSKTPTLFIHGDKDDFVPFSMLEQVYNACSAPKEKLVVEGAGHAKSSKVNPDMYWNGISKFLSKYI